MVTRSPCLDRGDGGDAHVDVLAGDLAADAAVLGQPLLGDVQPRHDLHARDDRGHELPRRLARLVEHAVDPVADLHLLLARLDVDVAGPLLDRVEHQRVDPADDRRLVGDLQDVDQLLAPPFVLLVPLLAEIAALVVLAAVDVVDDLEDALRRHQHRLHLGPELHAQIVERAHVERIGHRHHHHLALALDRQQAVLLGEADRDPRRQIGVDVVDLQLGAVGDPQLLPQRLQHLLLGDGARLDEDLAETSPFCLLRDERLLDHRGGEIGVAPPLELEQQLADPFACHRSASFREPAPARARGWRRSAARRRSGGPTIRWRRRRSRSIDPGPDGKVDRT